MSHALFVICVELAVSDVLSFGSVSLSASYALSVGCVSLAVSHALFVGCSGCVVTIVTLEYSWGRRATKP